MKTGIGKLSLILLLVMAACFQQAVSAADKARVMVFPFERGPAAGAISWLKEGLAVEVCRQLQLPQVETIDYEKRIEMVLASDLPPDASLSRASMIRVAQQAVADFLVMGSYSENYQSLKVVANVLDLKTLKLSADIVATGPLSAMPQMENELAWSILYAIGEMRDLSRETFRSRTRKVSNDAFALFIRSLTENDEVEAIKLLEQAVDQGKDFAEAQLRLGRYYFQQGDCAKAIPQLMAGHDDHGDYLQEEFMLATCYLETERLAEAIQTYEHLNSLSPGIESLNNQGVAYTRKGDYPSADENFIQARKLARTDPTINLNLSVLRHLQGDDSAARDILTEATKSYPNSGMIQFVFGVVLKALGDKEQADAALAKANNLGIQVDKLRSENPGSWTRIMPRGEYP